MKKLLLFLFFAILTIGCSMIPKDEESKGTNNKKAIETSSKPEVRQMILTSSDETAKSDQHRLYMLNKTSFTPHIEVDNDFPWQNTYRLFFFVDYKQVNVTKSGKVQPYVEVDLEARKRIKFDDISINNLEEGRHDFLLFLVRNPNKPLKKDEFIPTEALHLSRRSTLIVKKDIPPQPNFSKLENKIPNSDDSKSIPFISYKPTESLREALGVIDKSKSNKVWINFPTPLINKNYALIALLNNKQIKLKTPFITSNTNGTTSLPLPVQSFKHNDNLIIGVIERPFEKGEDNKGSLLEPWIPTYTNKITIK
ncbi:hypothetical protein J7E51_29255 [Priestia megaterium]|nr:hypothetical protein [Priestia megaterium]